MMFIYYVVGGVGAAVLLRAVWGNWRHKDAKRRVDGFYAKHSAVISAVETPFGSVTVLNANSGACSSKPSLFFVHGSCARMGQYEHQIEHFIAKGHHVVALDNLGCGESDKPDNYDAYHPSQFIDTAVMIAEKKLDGKKIVIVGHSFGSYVACRVTERVESIAGSVLLGISDFDELKKAEWVFKLPRPVLWMMRPLLGRGFQTKALYKGTGKELRMQEAEASSRNPVFMFSAFYRNLCRAEIVVAFPERPTLVISGRHDKVTPVDATSTLVEQYDFAYHKIVENASHQMMQEEPEVTNQHIDEFICKHVTM